MKKYCAVLIVTVSSLLQGADERRQRVESVHTERIDFRYGGTLRLKNAIGVLTVEAWDRPEVEITTIKSSKVEFDAPGRQKAVRELEKVVVVTDHRGDELVVTTKFPRSRTFPLPYPTKAETDFRLGYHIEAPATAWIADEHHYVGEVNIAHQSVSEESAAPHKLKLRAGMGDIVLPRTRIPKAPEPLSPAPKREGL